MADLSEGTLSLVTTATVRMPSSRAMIAAWHAQGVACHVGYIIGFPHDTYERVMEDVRTLRDVLLVDQMVEPIIMGPMGLRQQGTVMLRKVEA